MINVDFGTRFCLDFSVLISLKGVILKKERVGVWELLQKSLSRDAYLFSRTHEWQKKTRYLFLGGFFQPKGGYMGTLFFGEFEVGDFVADFFFAPTSAYVYPQTSCAICRCRRNSTNWFSRVFSVLKRILYKSGLQLKQYFYRA